MAIEDGPIHGQAQAWAPRGVRALTAVAALAALAACSTEETSFQPPGSGGGSAGAPPAWTAGTYPAVDSVAARCAVPRTGTNPATGRPYADRAGSVTWENHWIRSWSNEYYLWYSELPDVDPASQSSVLGYFDLMKTSALTASGNPKDRFHFTYDTAEWVALSQSGVQVAYGVEWALISTTPPRRAVAAYVLPNTPAAAAGIRRGTEIVTIDGVDLVNANSATDVDTLNAGLFPSRSGESHAFGVVDPGTSTPRTVTLVAQNVTSVPVQNVGTIQTPTGVVGYVAFHDHIAPAEQQLVAAFNQLSAAGVSDVVLDLRYNGGGFLDIASEVGFMIAGPGRTSGATFERVQFNDKYTTTNPITGEALAPVPFHSTARGFSVSTGTPLPTLNLSRVFVLTGPGTCSASESIINSLLGIDVQVVQIGSTTCGKPYGFYPEDNCGTTYFSIQFRGVNAKGFGDYADGFTPDNAPGAATTRVAGCSVADDFTRELGDPAEARLAAALQYRATSSCPAATGSSSPDAFAASDGRLNKPQFLMNRLLLRSTAR